jgi:hypothetical protein
MKFQKAILGVFLGAINSMWLFGQGDFEISRLDFNTRSKELAPCFYGDALVFCSDRKNDLIMTYTDQNNFPLTNLYIAEQKKPGRFESPGLMSKELTTFMFEGPSSFNKEGTMIYFTRSLSVDRVNRNNNSQDTTFGIFIAKKSNGVWSNITSFGFNSSAYNTGYPYITDDGLQLYFCSDAPGGYGGLDVYVSTLENGTWSEPANLGAEINTPENEVFPFIQKNGRLYFASRGYSTRGDLDVLYSIHKDGSWQKPVPLKGPFNTKNDDYGLIFNASSDTGYFVSDRNGSADIFAVYSTLPTFANCTMQKENDYCYVFYESNNNEIDTTAFAYEWNMGDGTKIRELEAEHCFASSGNYLVELNIIDKLTREVLISQATYNFTVEKTEQPFITCSDTVLTGDEVVFNGSESFIKDFEIVNYFWDFGDGSHLQGNIVKHAFTLPGIYQIRLGITGEQNAPVDAGKINCVTRQIVVANPKN